MVDLDDLQRRAEAATPGPWETEQRDVPDGRFLTHPVAMVVAGETNVARSDGANAEFIAAANPATVLALLGELRTARADADRLAASMRAVFKVVPPYSVIAINEALATHDALRGRTDGATPVKCWRCDGPLPGSDSDYMPKGPWEPICDTCHPLAVAEAEQRHSGVDLQTMPEPGEPTMNLLEGD